MNSVKIAVKLPALIVVLALLAAMATSVGAYVQARSNLEAEAQAKLTALAAGRASTLDALLKVIDLDLKTVAANHMIIDGIFRFTNGFEEYEDTAEKDLQRLFNTDNPNALGEKHKLDQAVGEDSTYNEVHANYHPWFRDLLEGRGYYDIFLMDTDGNVVYSVYKEADFATNLLEGPWKQSGLARVFKAVRDTPVKGQVAFDDFAPYAPSNGAPASFSAVPVFGHNGKFVGVLAFQMPIDRIDAILQQADGMGRTGETYLVGPDGKMRSNSRLAQQPTLLKTAVDTTAARAALAGKMGMAHDANYAGAAVLSLYRPVTFGTARYGLIAEIQKDELFEPVADMRTAMMVQMAILAGVLVLVGGYVARTLTRPLAAMTTAMAALADGDLDTDVPARGRGDEIGAMAAAVQVFKDNAQQVRKLEENQKADAVRAEAEKKAAMAKMADDFEASVGGIVGAVSDAAAHMNDNARTLMAAAQSTSEQSGRVSTAAEQASGNVETVATAAEQLSASISEISRKVSESSDIAGGAVRESETTNAQIQGLVDAANRIGEVVGLISDIAEQTNLLALNATIEAARAGDAGKGFAVVASEVKNLAGQTAKATEEISAQIAGIQNETQSAVAAIQGIAGTIGSINEVASTIASAVEEQGAATGEIARNVQEASNGTRDVTANIGGVNTAAGETGEAAGQVLEASEGLSKQADQLSGEVVAFLKQVRAG